MNNLFEGVGSQPTYKIISQDSVSKEIIVCILKDGVEEESIQIILDEWPADNDLNSKLRKDVIQLQALDESEKFSVATNEEVIEL